MSETRKIVATLKRLLRSRRLTYYDVADALNLSEASVKQMFATERFSLQRLERICMLLGMEIADLVNEVERGEQTIRRLTTEQETLLVSDTRLLLVAVSVLNHEDQEDVVRRYRLEPEEYEGLLEQLARMNLLRITGDDRVKLLVDRSFDWIKDGPIQTYFREQLQQEYFAGSFSGSGEALIFLPGILGEASRKQLISRMQSLADEFDELNRHDARQRTDGRSGTAMILAIRSWQLKAFRQLLR